MQEKTVDELLEENQYLRDKLEDEQAKFYEYLRQAVDLPDQIDRELMIYKPGVITLIIVGTLGFVFGASVF